MLTTQADLLSLYLGYSPSSTSNSALPKSCPHTILECLGWETPSQLGLQDKSAWEKEDTELAAVPRKLEGEQPTPAPRADHQGAEHQPHKDRKSVV